MKKKIFCRHKFSCRRKFSCRQIFRCIRIYSCRRKFSGMQKFWKNGRRKFCSSLIFRCGLFIVHEANKNSKVTLERNSFHCGVHSQRKKMKREWNTCIMHMAYLTPVPLNLEGASEQNSHEININSVNCRLLFLWTTCDFNIEIEGNFAACWVFYMLQSKYIYYFNFKNENKTNNKHRQFIQ